MICISRLMKNVAKQMKNGGRARPGPLNANDGVQSKGNSWQRATNSGCRTKNCGYRGQRRIVERAGNQKSSLKKEVNSAATGYASPLLKRRAVASFALF